MAVCHRSENAHEERRRGGSVNALRRRRNDVCHGLQTGRRRRVREERTKKGLQIPAFEFLIVANDQLPALDLDMAVTDKRVDHPGNRFT